MQQIWVRMRFTICSRRKRLTQYKVVFIGEGYVFLSDLFEASQSDLDVVLKTARMKPLEVKRQRVDAP